MQKINHLNLWDFLGIGASTALMGVVFGWLGGLLTLIAIGIGLAFFWERD